ncbi:MAG: endolytic transglycosylase MltG [Lachnospiraceae bacterium]|nr:endolytic transglycosylase MltG [Lachnospiraceae bacterium]
MKASELAASFIGFVIRVAIVIIAALFIYRGAKTAYDFGYRIFTEETVDEAPGRDVIVSISASEGLKDIAKMLEEKGLCKDWLLFFIQAKLSEYKDAFVPGTYTLNTSMTTDAMLMVMENIQAEVPEGEEEIEASEADELSESSLDNILGNEGDVYLGTEEESYEGEGTENAGEATEDAGE